jgi:hypothetical protein
LILLTFFCRWVGRCRSIALFWHAAKLIALAM